MLTTDNNGVSQTSYTFKKQFIVTSNASGQIVITAGTNETFNAVSNSNYVITVLDDGSGGCNDGDVIAVTQTDGLTSVVVAGDSKTVTFTDTTVFGTSSDCVVKVTATITKTSAQQKNKINNPAHLVIVDNV